MTATDFLSGFLGSNAVEISAALCGFICLILLIKGSIWNFAFGFVQVTLYVWVFYEAQLYADTGLHIVYMGLQLYGWWNWSRHLASASTVAVLPMNPPKTLVALLMIALVSSAALGTSLHLYTNASFAFADAFTTCASLLAFVLMTRRYIVNWLVWIAVDVVAIVVYFQKELYPTALLYVCFLIMAIVGFYAWQQQLSGERTHNQAPVQ